MIKNQKQAVITKGKLAELKKAKNELEAKKNEYSPVEYKLAENSFNGLIEDLESQIKTYESLVGGSFHCLKPKNIEDIPNILIAARLAQKMSQKDLADAIGIQEQQIQRYEAADYEGASWTRIVEVILALNLQFYFESIIIINSEVSKEVFEYPKGVDAEEIRLAEDKIKFGHSLIFT